MKNKIMINILEFDGEDHTLGYLIQYYISKYSNYAGYHVPHPLEKKMIIKYEKNIEDDALLLALNDILHDIREIKKSIV